MAVRGPPKTVRGMPSTFTGSNRLRLEAQCNITVHWTQLPIGNLWRFGGLCSNFYFLLPSRNHDLPPTENLNWPNFFCLKADGLILGFEIFGFGPSKPKLRHFSFVLKNANLPLFLPLLGKILVLRVLPAYRKKFGCFHLNPPAPAARGGGYNWLNLRMSVCTVYS